MLDKKHGPGQPSTPGAGARLREAAHEIAPFHNAIRRQLAEAVNKAVASAQTAYAFSPGSYTAQALSDALAIREMLWRLGEVAAYD